MLNSPKTYEFGHGLTVMCLTKTFVGRNFASQRLIAKITLPANMITTSILQASLVPRLISSFRVGKSLGTRLTTGFGLPPWIC